MDKQAENNNSSIAELENLMVMQDIYTNKIIELGLFYENNGQTDRAFQIYKKSLEKINKVKSDISYTMLGLIS